MKRGQKYLSGLIKTYDLEERPFIYRTTGNIFLWLVFTIVLIVAMQAFEAGNISLIVLVIIAMFLGMSVGVYVFMKWSWIYWAFLKPHVDIESIKKREAEL